MFPDFLLNILHLSFVGPEVRRTPGPVVLDVQVEPVEQGEGGDGDDAAQGQEAAAEEFEETEEREEKLVEEEE